MHTVKIPKTINDESSRFVKKVMLHPNMKYRVLKALIIFNCKFFFLCKKIENKRRFPEHAVTPLQLSIRLCC